MRNRVSHFGAGFSYHQILARVFRTTGIHLGPTVSYDHGKASDRKVRIAKSETVSHVPEFRSCSRQVGITVRARAPVPYIYYVDVAYNILRRIYNIHAYILSYSSKL